MRKRKETIIDRYENLVISLRGEIDRLRSDCEKNKRDNIALCCEIATQQDEIERLRGDLENAERRGYELADKMNQHDRYAEYEYTGTDIWVSYEEAKEQERGEK